MLSRKIRISWRYNKLSHIETQIIDLLNYTDIQCWILNSRPPNMQIGLEEIGHKMSLEEYEKFKILFAKAKEETKTMFRSKTE